MAIFPQKANVLIGRLCPNSKFETKFPQGFDVEKDHHESKAVSAIEDAKKTDFGKGGDLRDTGGFFTTRPTLESSFAFY